MPRRRRKFRKGGGKRQANEEIDENDNAPVEQKDDTPNQEIEENDEQAEQKVDVQELVGLANEVKAEVEQAAAAEKQPKFACFEVVGGMLYTFI